MKTTILLVLLTLSSLGFTQDNQRIDQIMEIIEDQDSISREVFLDSTTIQHMRLTSTSNWRQVWSDIDDSIKSIGQFYDIRIKFDSNEAAKNFHSEYLPENSENGPEIKKHKIKIDGVEDLSVFTQSKMMSDMFLTPYGFQALCFVFVVDNYFVKIYVTCLKEYKPKYLEKYITAVRDKIELSNEQ